MSGSTRPKLLTAALAFVVLASLSRTAAQQPQTDSDPESVLRRTRGRVLAELEKMPRYTCVQTITRQYYWPPSKHLSSCSTLMAEHQSNPANNLQLRGWDRLRLEVGIVGGDTVYSWVGAPRFESDALEQLAGRGPLSSGDFGSFLTSIFTEAIIEFKSKIEDTAGGKQLLAYSYDMPVERSQYSISYRKGWVITAYSGTMVIDPEATDIARLTVHTAELPEDNPDCQAISEVDYGRTEIHERMVLLPRQTRLITINRQGSEAHSLTTYSSCREYASKVRMLFDFTPGAAAADSKLPQQNPPTAFPAGLQFRAGILTPIDSKTAAAGDPIEAVLLTPIRGKDNDRREWAPAKARLHGRLLDFSQPMGQNFFQVRIQFESIELNGSSVPFHAAPDLTGLNGMMMSGGRFLPPLSVISDETGKNVFILRKQRLEKFDWGWTTLECCGTSQK